MKRKLVVISHDAMVYEDLEYLGKLPEFGKMLREGALVKTLRTIYPTITYPVHTTILTGTYPNRHGIINNELTNVGELASPWHFFSEDIKVKEDLFTAAKKAGYSTASVFWPVTGNHPAVDYLINEYWTQTQEDSLEDAFRRTGSSEEVMEKVVLPNLPKLVNVERQHPGCDEFIISCAVDMIRNFQPDVLLVHPAAIDGARHQSGLFGEKVDESLANSERWTKMIVEATKEAGVFEQTDFVLMSDHGQMDIKRAINLNVLLCDHGLIETNEAGDMVDWQAYCKSAGMSSQVYLKNPQDKAVYDKVYRLLCDLAEEGIYGFTQVFTKEEIEKKERLGGDFSFVVETDGYTTFGNNWRRPLVRAYDLSDYRFGRATHGYLPDRGPQPTFIACGPSFEKGAVVERRPIVDTTATFAKVLHLDLLDLDGEPIDEILKAEA